MNEYINKTNKTCKMIEQGDSEEYVRWFACQECMECVPSCNLSMPNYCPNCGAKTTC